MIYYKHIDAQYNPLKNCNTLKIGSYYDYKKNYGESDIADKLEGIWGYTAEPKQEFSMDINLFNKWFMAGMVEIAGSVKNVSIGQCDIGNTVDGLKVKGKHNDLRIDADASNVYFQPNIKIDMEISAPNTYIFCLTTSCMPPKGSNYDDYYTMTRKNETSKLVMIVYD